MHLDADDVDARPTAAGPLTALAFMAPWAVLALALPEPWRWQGLALMGLLGFLLVLAAGAAERIAASKRLDGAWWAFLAVVTLGYALAALLLWPAGAARGQASFMCGSCARIGSVHEPFCFGCGTYS